jgi:hypothetical protein
MSDGSSETQYRQEILALEERLRQAELGPDPAFFEEYLADDALIDGQRLKARIVAAHRPQPGKGPKFSRVEMRDVTLIEHGPVVVVACGGSFEGPDFTGTLKFMRVWLNENGKWTIVAAATLADQGVAGA